MKKYDSDFVFVEKVLETKIDELRFEPIGPDNKYVITGAPGSGKTTLVDGLKKRGLYVVPEMARMIIDHQLLAGGDALPWANREKFQQYNILGQIIQMQNLPKNETVILDRALPDNLAYFINDGVDVPDYYNDVSGCFQKYAQVFIPEQLPVYENDYARKESFDEAKKLHELLRYVYKRTGNILTEIPVFDVPNDRIDHVYDMIISKKKIELGDGHHAYWYPTML